MTEAETKFCDDIETVSGQLADWARRMIKDFGWSVSDCKIHLRNAAEKTGRE